MALLGLNIFCVLSFAICCAVGILSSPVLDLRRVWKKGSLDWLQGVQLQRFLPLSMRYKGKLICCCTLLICCILLFEAKGQLSQSCYGKALIFHFHSSSAFSIGLPRKNTSSLFLQNSLPVKFPTGPSSVLPDTSKSGRPFCQQDYIFLLRATAFLISC